MAKMIWNFVIKLCKHIRYHVKNDVILAVEEIGLTESTENVLMQKAW